MAAEFCEIWRLLIIFVNMLTNSEIKQIRSLREKKFRDELGMFAVEGEKMVAEALKSSFEVVRVIREEEVGAAAMSRISQCSSPSPVLAIVRLPREEAPSALPDGLVLALDSVRDPGNFGTILRIADWFGVNVIFASPDCVETFNPKTVQASMGSVFRVRVYRRDIPSVCREFATSGRPVYGTVLDGDNIYSSELSPTGLVVMGNESTGISQEVSALLDHRLRIPSFGGGAESLNVAVATAVTLSEFRRR